MKNSEDINIWVISHNDIDDLFNYDYFHKHIHVGAAINTETKHKYRDDLGDNISIKNPFFCELTGIYWVLKNVEKVKYIGFEHYRRHFDLTDSEIKNILETYDIILPTRTWFQTSINIHYQNIFSKHDFETIEKIVKELYPQYSKSWDLYMMQDNTQYSRNMFITKYEIFDEMYTFIFNVLNEFILREKLYTNEDFEKHVLQYSQHMIAKDHQRINTSWVTYQMRLLGLLAEELTTLWVKHNIPENKRHEIDFIFKEDIIPTNKIW